MSRRERAAHRTTIVLVGVLVIAVQAGAVTGTANGVDLKQTIGTVTAVRPDEGRISVITGCGHALREVVFHAGTACRIEVDGAVASLANLRRGQIVEVRYRIDAVPYDAQGITTRPGPHLRGPK